MPRPRPHRPARRRACALVALAPLAATACDGASSGRAPFELRPPLRLTLVGTTPSGDTLAQPGFELAARLEHSLARGAVVYVDSGTAAERRVVVKDALVGYDDDQIFGALFATTSGRHRFTLVATDTAGRTASVSFTRTFVIPEEPYRLAPLPGPDGAAAVGISAAGQVAGWITEAPGGRRRPAVWRGETLERVPATDSGDVVAVATNSAGDVLLQYDPARLGRGTARVRRADGVELTFASTTASAACCERAVALTEARAAVASSPTRSFAGAGVVLDLTRDAPPTSYPIELLAMNARGQLAGVEVGGYMMAGRFLRTFGLDPFAPLTGHAVTICDRAGRFGRTIAMALADDGSVLANSCGNVVLLGSARSAYVDRHVGRTLDVELSARGGVVAALDSAGRVLLWRVATDRTTIARLDAGGWRLDALAGVTGDGVIAANGVHMPTGRRAALLLVPAAPR